MKHKRNLIRPKELNAASRESLRGIFKNCKTLRPHYDVLSADLRDGILQNERTSAGTDDGDHELAVRDNFRDRPTCN